MLWEEGDSNRRHRKYKLGYEASALTTELRRQCWINAVKLQKLQIVMQWHTGINQCTSPSLASCGAAYGAPTSSTTWWYANAPIILNMVLQMCCYFKHHMESNFTNLLHVVLPMVLACLSILPQMLIFYNNSSYHHLVLQWCNWTRSKK